MIKVAAKTKQIREVTCAYEYTDAKGKPQTEEIRVRYFSFTWNEMQAEHARLSEIAKNDPSRAIWPHESLASRIESLPDLLTADGKPFAITAKNLGDLDTKNLEAIKSAIEEDFSGKAQQPKSRNG